MGLPTWCRKMWWMEEMVQGIIMITPLVPSSILWMVVTTLMRVRLIPVPTLSEMPRVSQISVRDPYRWWKWSVQIEPISKTFRVIILTTRVAKATITQTRYKITTISLRKNNHNSALTEVRQTCSNQTMVSANQKSKWDLIVKFQQLLRKKRRSHPKSTLLFQPQICRIIKRRWNQLNRQARAPVESLTKLRKSLLPDEQKKNEKH